MREMYQLKLYNLTFKIFIDYYKRGKYGEVKKIFKNFKFCRIIFFFEEFTKDRVKVEKFQNHEADPYTVVKNLMEEMLK